jgi:hypothetical protein
VSKAREIVDSWDVKHWGRKPIADSSFQYKTREDLIAMFDTELTAQAAEIRGLREAFQKLRDTIEFGPFFGDVATNCVVEADKALAKKEWK